MDNKKRLSISITTLVLICFGLCVTSFALAYTVLEVQNNYFQTGIVDIDIKWGEVTGTPDSVTDNTDSLGNGLFTFSNIEPGATLERQFHVTNNSTDPNGVWYKVYFSGVKGELAEVLEVTVLGEDGTEIFSGILDSLGKNDVPVVPGELLNGESKNFTVRFHLPEETGNKYNTPDPDDMYLEFVLNATAVQVKNNPNADGLDEAEPNGLTEGEGNLDP